MTDTHPSAEANGTEPYDDESHTAGSNSGSESAPRPPNNTRFTDEELDSMLYEWDEGVYPVQEYHVKVLQEPPPAKPANDGKAASGEEDGGEEMKVYLDFNTEEEAYVIEFYQPWCPHCRHLKPEYIEIANAVSRRSVATLVNFCAVSCELYEYLCRTYEVDGYPTILGYAVGSDTFVRGVELNGEDAPQLSAESIAELLNIEIANEAQDGWESEYSNSEDRRNRENEKKEAGTKAAKLKRQWQSFPSTVNDRYHNAGLSLAFALKTGVYGRFGKLSDDRALVLSDFLDLVDWATPQAWSVRTGLVKELRLRFHDVVVSGKNPLVDLVERNQNMHEEVKGDGAMIHLWGHIDVPRRQRRNKVTGLGGDVPDAKRRDAVTGRNRKWTEACTHSKPAMGFTCGLWDLLHILTIGASMQDHQLYGFHAGYLTSHRDVALIIRNFVASFFACDVCRWNFIDMFDNCGHDHCNRLPSESAIILGKNGSIGRGAELSKELPLWLFEVHNVVNVRLMRESAEHDNREATVNELRAAVFPPKKLCPKCWTDIESNEYDPDAVYAFLKDWYWPAKEVMDPGFSSVLNRNLLAKGIRVAPPKASASSFMLTLTITAAIFALIIKLVNSGSESNRQQLHYSQNRTGTAQKRRFKRPPV